MAKILTKVREDASGADVGSQEIFLSIEGQPVVHYGTDTASLEAAIAYLQTHGITSLAMEATGVYWLSFYDLAESAGLQVYLVHPKYTKSRSRKKTDVADCQWIQALHSVDLLEGSYIPPMEIRMLRHYIRLREDHIRTQSMQVNLMHKALVLLNIRLDGVLSQVHGASGLRMIEAILDGERDPHTLLALCDKRVIKHKSERILAALKGNYQPQYLFALRQALEAFKFYQEQIEACDQQIAQWLEEHTAHLPTPEEVGKAKPIRHHKPKITDLQGKMVTLMGGKDLTKLTGLTNYSLLRLVAEVGLDLQAWPSKKHFTSWLGLAPGQHQSGKSRKRHRSRSRPIAGQIFRQIAQSLLNSKHNALGVFGRRLRAKKGPAIAIKALARKLAERYYLAVTKGIEYVEEGAKAYEKQYHQQQLAYIQKKAQVLGLQLIETNTA